MLLCWEAGKRFQGTIGYMLCVSGNKAGLQIGKLIFWPPDVKNQLIGKDPDAGKDWRQDKKGKRENEMVGWHYWLKDMSLSKFQDMVKDR